MSHNDPEATDELACKHGCGKTAGNPGALARHEQACDAKDSGHDSHDYGASPADVADIDAGEESPEGFRADDMEAHEIADAVRLASGEVLEATVERLDYSPTPEERIADSAAKAIVRAKGGGREMFADTFGTCDADGCDYGLNGFSVRFCKRHEGSDADDADAKAAAAEGTPGSRATDAAEAAGATREAVEHDGVAVAADLLADGVPGERAADAVRAAESVNEPESWAAAYGRTLDRVAEPAAAKAFADALFPDA